MDAGPTHVDIVLPDLGCDAVTVTVWFCRPGDRVYKGDRVLEVAAASATFDIVAPATGVLAEQLVFPRDRVTASQRLGAMTADGED